MIKLTCKDPEMDKIPAVREYLDYIEVLVTKYVTTRLFEFDVFGAYQIELPDIHCLKEVEQDLLSPP